MPKAEEESVAEEPAVQQKPTELIPAQHQDQGCPHLETISQLKGQIKRLRQELILKGPSTKKT